MIEMMIQERNDQSIWEHLIDTSTWQVRNQSLFRGAHQMLFHINDGEKWWQASYI